MKEFICSSAYFGVLLSVASYCVGRALRNRFKKTIFNPVLIAIVLTIAVLLLLDVDYASYNASAKYLSYLLTPTTVCLAIPLYSRIQALKSNYKAILIGICSGVLTSMCCVLLLAALFRLDHAQYVTLLPKSITTAIGISVVEELGGYPSIAAPVIIITGVLGNIFAEGFLRLIRIREPIARGVAIGTACHAIGTARALEMGEIEGAMSSLSIAVAGVITVIAAPIFAGFL